MSIRFCGLRFSGLNKAEILSNANDFQQIVTVGAEFIIEAHKNKRLMHIINNNVSTFDGQVPYFFAKKKIRNLKFEKISGADFIYDVCKEAQKNNEKIFLLGGFPQSNELSLKKLHEMGIIADGYAPGFIPYPFPKDKLNYALAKIKDFNPKYLFVGLGMCKQEYFIDDNRDFLKNCGVRIAVGSGGTFEVFSGRISRAPIWMRKAGLEGFYRLLKDPSLNRLKRLASTIKFLKYINR